jgi:hypothetical protein
LDWFERYHDIPGWDHGEYGFYHTVIEKVNYLWQPPPVAAEVAVEQLYIARIKRQDSYY